MISCASFGASLGMTARSAKTRSIPRSNTTGNLSLQQYTSTSPPVSSPASRYNASSRKIQHLPHSQSSNTLILPTGSRIPTPIRPSPCKDTLSTREPSIALWTQEKPAATTTATQNAQPASVNQTLPEIDANVLRNQDQRAGRSPPSLLTTKPLVSSNTRLALGKARQIQRRPVPPANRPSNPSDEQTVQPPQWSAASFIKVNSQRKEGTASSRISLPLKVRSSQDMLETRSGPVQSPRATSGGITHFSSRLVNLDRRDADCEKRCPPKEVNPARWETMHKLESTSSTSRRIHLVRSSLEF